jgi:hypothetical protein
MKVIAYVINVHCVATKLRHDEPGIVTTAMNR